MRPDVIIGGCRFSADYVDAIGVVECLARARESIESDRLFKEKVNPMLAEQGGYRLANAVDEPGAHFAWFVIDDRPMDDGKCKLWVVKL